MIEDKGVILSVGQELRISRKILFLRWRFSLQQGLVIARKPLVQNALEVQERCIRASTQGNLFRDLLVQGRTPGFSRRT